MIIALASNTFAQQAWTWTPVGPGGGGALRSPGLSPHDPNVILCANDMGGWHRSGDAGASWQAFPQSALHAPRSTARPWAFHPVDPSLVLVGSAYGFFRSTDGGRNWLPIDGPWNTSDANGLLRRGPRVIVFDPRDPDTALAAFPIMSGASYARLFLSLDRGDTWLEVTGLPASAGAPINVRFVPASTGTTIVIAAEKGVYRSTDDGVTWQASMTGLPGGGTPSISDFDGAPVDSGSVLFVTAETPAQVALGHRKLYRSTDGGLTWTRRGNTGLFANDAIPSAFTTLAVSPAQPSIVYATISGGDTAQPSHPVYPTVYRSADGAHTWTPVLFQDVSSSRYNITGTSWLTGGWGVSYIPNSLEVDKSNPDRVMATTITSAFLTTDGGASWNQVHAPAGTASAQPAGGMMVMSAWRYYIDPVAPTRRLIAMTDFGGWLSTNGGSTWQYRNNGNPWPNTYALAIDPADSSRVWAASSQTHDIPFWNYQSGLGTYDGGVAKSLDGGLTWSPVPVETTSGLPRKAVTDICLDPTSQSGARRLWAAVPGYGVYFSQNDGATWTARNNGLDTNNRNILRIKRHSSGWLYALSTYKPSGYVPGSLYASPDQGLTWTKIFTPAAFPTDFALDPNQPGMIYVTALYPQDAINTWQGGGVWKTLDNGATWTLRLNKPAYSIAVDPANTSRLLLSCWYRGGDGLYTSADSGATWARVDNYPFWRPLSVTHDPANPGTVYVTNFGGGVYRGMPITGAPATPTGLTPLPGNTRSHLSWTAASGATSYTIKRATVSGGPYATVADGITATSWSDAGLSNGTSYHYVISAVNGNGAGAQSAQVSATPQAIALVKDNSDSSGIALTGSWTASISQPGFYGSNYLTDGNTGGGKAARFTPTVATRGYYDVYLRWTAYSNRASNAPIDIRHSAGTTTKRVDQRFNDAAWVWLGSFLFETGTTGYVTVRNDGADGHVIADAVRLELR